MQRILALAFVAALLGGGQPAAADSVGFVAVANGDVSVQHGGAWQAASTDAEVEVGDAIRTGTGASAKVVLVDDTLLQIDEETELRIETWHVGDAATKDVSIVRQARGRLRATVGDAFGGSTNMEVHIPTAAIGIKGTDFEVVQDGLWQACLLSGGITVANSFGTASPKPGQCVYAYGDKAPGDPFPNPRTPLDVDEDTGGKDDVADNDFVEPIRAPVSADGDGGGSLGDPPKGEVGDPYDSTTGDSQEDELENFEIPDAEPPINDDRLG